MCFDNLNGINNIGNTFLHIYNMSDEDLITMTNSEITSPDLVYSIYMESNLVDNSTKVNINMCQFYNISSSVFKWYSDDNDGNVYFNMNVSNSNFTISALNDNNWF